MCSTGSRKHRAKLIGCVIAAVASVAATAAIAAAAGMLTVSFISVGQGDATSFEGPCGEIGVLDVPSGRAPDLIRALDGLGSRRIRWLTVSHYDADHLGGVVSLAETAGVEIGTVYDRGTGRGQTTGLRRRYTAWLDLAPEGVSKASALAQIAVQLDVDQADVLAIGDGRNDVEMLAWAGRGVAMGQAPDSVKAIADSVTETLEDDGAAHELARCFGFAL